MTLLGSFLDCFQHCLAHNISIEPGELGHSGETDSWSGLCIYKPTLDKKRIYKKLTSTFFVLYWLGHQLML